MDSQVLTGLALPFIGTTLGALTVLLMKKQAGENLTKLLLGFASGVMVAASFWSLLLPALEQVEKDGGLVWFPAALGFLIGIGFLLLLDTLTPHLHRAGAEPEGLPSKARKNTLLMLAVTLHNIPEGMAVGVVLASYLANPALSFAPALALCLGIAIQNFPEGMIVSFPLIAQGQTRKRAALMGVLSGAVEPVAALITLWLTRAISQALPYTLAFAAGAMLYVVVEELIPGLQEGHHSNIGILGFALGFVLMMILDVALG